LDYTQYIYFSEYLIDVFDEKRAKNPSFSVRAFSKFLGYKNPTLLNDILRRKRKPTVEIALRLSHKLSYPKHRTDYLIKICEYERARGTQERDAIMLQLRKLLAQKKWEIIDVNQLDLINNPFLLLIYNMIALKDFKPDAAYLNKRLRFKISQKQIDHALETLIALKYVRVDRQGNYKFVHEQAVITAENPGANPQVMDQFHQSLLTLTQSAIENHSPKERDVRATILPLRKKDFELILDEITQSHQKAATYAVDSGADDVYILSTHLVPFSGQLEPA
jgi:uncharacterized protein (TIGR02147 family)